MSINWSFRGFDATGQKGWVYGDLVHNQKVTCEGLEPRVMVGGYEVVPESVGICIGKTDDHGNTLYEGDICKIACYGRLFLAVIVYVDYKGSFGFMSDSGFSYFDYASTIQRVGTLYENKQLLSNH